ncbi:MAG: IS3 family transposase, partial [Nonlabens sp.]
METPINISYVKRTQKDYSLSFKLQVVEEIESGQLDRLNAHLKYGIQARSTITSWLRKYGTFDWENLSVVSMSKTPEQKIIELEAKVKLLEKQKARAEHLVERADKKVIIFDMLVDMAEKEYDIEIRKN